MGRFGNTEWCRDYSNVVALGQWLLDNAEIETAVELQYFYSKPWKWTEEWQQMQAEQAKVTA